MEIKKQADKFGTVQYIVKDANDFAITEVLGGEEDIVVFIYNEDGFCVGMFRMICCRGVYDWGGMIWCTQNEDENFDADELNIIAQYIIEQHNKDNEIITEAMNET